MELGYYPGCALHGSSIEYGKSVEKLFEAMGVNLVEIPDWCCCGASSAHMIHHKLPTALNARNLGLATEAGISEIVTPCPLCSEGMLKALQKIGSDPKKRAQMEEITGRKIDPELKVLNVVQALEHTREIWEPKLRENTDPIKAACYYGCLMVRPPEVVNFDNPEKPVRLDALVKAFGYEPVEWSFKTECCGGGFTVSNPGDVATLVSKIYDNALFHGAEMIVTICPMCLANLEMRASEAENKTGKKYRLPVVYITDLLGLAIGMAPEELGLDKHGSDVSSLA